MRVGLMGFGKAGKAVAAMLLINKEMSLQWVIRKSSTLEHRSVPEFLGIDSDEPGLIYQKDEFSSAELLDKFPVDIIIDFSSSEGIEYYGKEAAKRGITIISTISQYSNEKVEMLKKFSRDTCVLWSPNITIGINFLIIAAKVLKNIAPDTDIEVTEEHFKAKQEVSGTAKIIAKQLKTSESSINTIRAGGIIGTHEILFGFPYQNVRLKHESITREAFGNGALFAALNLHGKPKGFYTMEDLLSPYFELIKQ